MTGRHVDDDPLDLEAVGADDALIEQLRRSVSPESGPTGAVVWGDDEDDVDDPSYALLRALQLDVSADLPTGPVLPGEVVPLRSARRSLGRTATVAAVAAGVLSLAGVAAAASSQPVRSAVADAVSSVVHAITPNVPVGPAPSEPATALPAPTSTPPGQLVADVARSAGAARFIGAALARAADLTETGRYTDAAKLLDAAEHRLPLVTPTDGHDALAALIEMRRKDLAAAQAANPTPTHGPSTNPTGRSTEHPRPTRVPSSDKGEQHPTQQQPGRGPAATTPTGTRSVGASLPTTWSTHGADKATQGR